MLSSRCLCAHFSHFTPCFWSWIITKLGFKRSFAPYPLKCITKKFSSPNLSSLLSAVQFNLYLWNWSTLSANIPFLINQLSTDLYGGHWVKLTNIFCFNVLCRAEIWAMTVTQQASITFKESHTDEQPWDGIDKILHFFLLALHHHPPQRLENRHWHENRL